MSRPDLGDALVVLGVACLAAFCWFLWPPALLALAGVVLITVGIVKAARGNHK